MQLSSLQLENIKPTCLERMKSWVHEHPTTIKVVKMAGLILGFGLLIVPFLTAGFGVPANTCFVISGGALVTAALKSEMVLVNLPSRKYPPLSLSDTVKMTRNDQGERVIRSVHGTCNIFEDKEIIAYHPVLRQELLGEHENLNTGEEEEVYIDFTQNEKAIIQQQAIRGCTAATAAMLIKDQGGKPDFSALQRRNLGNDEDIQQDIQNAGFKPIITPLASNSLEMFRKQLLEYGSAIVSILDPQAGAHSIIVDEISKNLKQVRLRDPYHGWEITVSAEAFQPRWVSQSVIQIENKVSSQKNHSCDNALNA